MLELEVLSWEWAPRPSNVKPGEIVWKVGDEAATWYGAAYQRRSYLETLVRACHDPEGCKARGVHKIDLCRPGAAGTAYYKVLLEIMDRDPTKIPGIDDEDGDLELGDNGDAALEEAVGNALALAGDVCSQEQSESESEGRSDGRRAGDEVELAEPIFDVGGGSTPPAGGTRTPGREEDSDDERGLLDMDVAGEDRRPRLVDRLPAGEASENAAFLTGLERKAGAHAKFTWGAFEFDMKSSREWFADCPYHRLHSTYGCRKYLTVDDPGGDSGEDDLVQAHVNVINRLKYWCLEGQCCNRQRFHVAITPSLEDIPEALVMDTMVIADNLTERPDRSTIATDVQLDEADVAAGIALEQPARRKRKRMPAAKPKVKAKSRAKRWRRVEAVEHLSEAEDPESAEGGDESVDVAPEEVAEASEESDEKASMESDESKSSGSSSDDSSSDDSGHSTTEDDDSEDDRDSQVAQGGSKSNVRYCR